MNSRYKLYQEMVSVLDEAFELMVEYDSVPHDYGSATLYQAESKLIHLAGSMPGITASELAARLKKTTSACSQIVKKLRKKGWIEQTRNEKNNREYNLFLTDEGKKIFQDHEQFESRCYMRMYRELEEFDENDFQIYMAIQRKMNKSFVLDVEESRMQLGQRDSE